MKSYVSYSEIHLSWDDDSGTLERQLVRWKIRPTVNTSLRSSKEMGDFPWGKLIKTFVCACAQNSMRMRTVA